MTDIDFNAGPDLFTPAWGDTLGALLAVDTRNPLESGRLTEAAAAQELLAERAADAGFKIAHFAPAAPESLDRAYVPQSVREAARAFGPRFLASQPNLVLRMGRPRPAAQTLVGNFHIDTVNGLWTPRSENGAFVGRGAVDDKGPGVAILAGIAGAVDRHPEILDHTQILIQSVCGEEGGAMGVYGTKALMDAGFGGRLTIFAEPSDGVYFDSATSTMTARVDAHGEGTTDDFPADGDNATVLLSSICRTMARLLGPQFEIAGRKMCIGGISTGTMHNRVFGSGSLHINFAYSDEEHAAAIGPMVERAFEEALLEAERDFRGMRLFARSAERARSVCSLTWVKRGLPVLRNRDAEMEVLLSRAGLTRCPPERMTEAFTCDAMWAQEPGRYAVVFGPGSLAANHAHADGEFVTVSDLERYARQIAGIVQQFATACKRAEGKAA